MSGRDSSIEDTDERRALPTLKRTAKKFQADNMTDWAAALTYYGLLSLFPAMIALVSVLGLFGNAEGTVTALTDIVVEIGPDSAADTFAGPIESIVSNRSAAGVLFFVGLAGAIWSASGYIGAFTRASNVAWEQQEGRGFLKLRPLQIGITLLLVILFALVSVSVVMTGPIVAAVGDSIGIGDTALTVWDIAKWPVLLGALLLIIGILYYAAPNVEPPGFRWLTVGSLVALLAWIAGSAAFAAYVANFGSYDATYGSLGAIVTLLIWMWISNLALLFGLELNAERERGRQMEAGVPNAERELDLPAREAPEEQG